MSIEQELRAAAGKATPGPWVLNFESSQLGWNSADYFISTPSDPCWMTDTPYYPSAPGPEDAAYIVAAQPANILALLDRLEKMREALTNARVSLVAFGGDLDRHDPQFGDQIQIAVLTEIDAALETPHA